MLNSLGSFFILGNLVLSDFGVMLGEILTCLFKAMFSSSFNPFLSSDFWSGTFECLFEILDLSCGMFGWRGCVVAYLPFLW